MMLSPTLAVAGPVLTIFRSGETTVLVVVDVQLSGSLHGGPTVAVLVMVPTVLGLTMIVNVLLAPMARAPTLHVRARPVAVQPGSFVTRSTVVGRLSLTSPVVLGAVPILVTVRL